MGTKRPPGRDLPLVSGLQEEVFIPKTFPGGGVVEYDGTGQAALGIVVLCLYLQFAAVAQRVVQVGLALPRVDVGVVAPFLGDLYAVYQRKRIVAVGG